MQRYEQIQEEQTDYVDSLFQESLKEYYALLEKTFNISKDVDFIYNKYFKAPLSDFRKKGILPKIDRYGQLHSSDLKPKKAIEANKTNPVDITCGVDRLGNYYDSNSKKIGLSLNYSAIGAYGGKASLSPNDLKAIETEFSDSKVKSSIYHELAHWIGDSLHNNYISNLIARVKKIPEFDPDRKEKVDKIKSMGLPHVNMTHYEIDAQIHGIKQAKRTYKKEWDTMTIAELFYKYISLRQIARTLYKIGKDVYTTWIKDLIKRMNREGLLGKNMRDFPEYKMIESYNNKDLFKI